MSIAIPRCLEQFPIQRNWRTRTSLKTVNYVFFKRAANYERVIDDAQTLLKGLRKLRNTVKCRNEDDKITLLPQILHSMQLVCGSLDNDEPTRLWYHVRATPIGGELSELFVDAIYQIRKSSCWKIANHGVGYQALNLSAILQKLSNFLLGRPGLTLGQKMGQIMNRRTKKMMSRKMDQIMRRSLN